MKTLKYATADDTNKLIDLINDDTAQCSGMMLDSLRPTQVRSPYDVRCLIKTLAVIETIGWTEHTCDWDLYLYVELKSGEALETNSGYSKMTLSDDELTVIFDDVTYDSDYEPTEITHRPLLADILSIAVNR